MSGKPPRDGDDIWSEVMDQVADALGEVSLDSDGTRDALLEGVRQALEGMGSTIDLDIQVVTEGVDTSDVEDPSVSVMEGGRTDTDPRTPGDKPDLRVADLPEDGFTEETEPVDPVDAMQGSPVVTQVKVLRTPPRRTAHSEAIPGLGQAGWIQVASGGGAQGAWQTLYQGQRARLYRIGCTQGLLDVTVDGAPVERLRAGQSVDVEGCLVRVSAVDETSGRGGYAWISAPEAEE